MGVADDGRLLPITGGARHIAGGLRSRGFGDDEAAALARRVHRSRAEIFRSRVADGAIARRPGLPELVADLVADGICKQGN